MIHYHGTPLTPRSELEKCAGHHFCVSFANPGDADWCLRYAQSVMWDSGAFTAHTKGREVDWNKYYSWLEKKLGGENWAVVPDVIGGDQSQQKKLVRTWPYPKSAGAPVWHMGLDISYLLQIAEKWPRICFGSSDQYWQVGSDAWRRRADEAFNALAIRGHLPWLKVHMLRGLSLCGDRWPFSSADSVNVARNFKDTNICPDRMMSRIDAVQSPISWIARENPEPEVDMFAQFLS